MLEVVPIVFNREDLSLPQTRQDARTYTNLSRSAWLKHRTAGSGRVRVLSAQKVMLILKVVDSELDCNCSSFEVVGAGVFLPWK